MRYVYDDGGRAAAGYRGRAGDCVTRAIAIATETPYTEVYAAINALAKGERLTKRKRARSSSRDGVHKDLTRRYLETLGWRWVPTMRVGTGCRVHLREGELPPGRLIVSVSRHLVAVVDGVLRDTSDPSRRGRRCVYGYWYKPPAEGE